jgi:hypothetical protein
LENGLNLSLLVHELFANPISAFFGVDVIVSAIALCVFVRVDGGRFGARARWLPIVATLLVGVSLGLPLFLYLRQLHLDRTTEAPPLRERGS